MASKLVRMVRLNKSRIEYLEKFQQMIDEYNAGSVNVDYTFTYAPNQLLGGNEIAVAFIFDSDGGWSDGDCLWGTAGATVLDAATRLGIEIPTLCFLKGYEPSTSCQVCLVRNRQTKQLVPACATRVSEGMQIESETPQVHAIRRTALEVLLSDHVGECLAPCFFACPAHMDIPLMLRQIGDHELGSAIATIKRDIALPAVLGRICPKPCAP